MSFGNDIAKWSKGTLEEIDADLQRLVLELFSEIVRRTPVDTGRARANWSIAAHLPSGSFSIVSLSPKVKSKVVYIFNSVPYIIPLENGHSKQAPPGYMVQGSISKIRNERS